MSIEIVKATEKHAEDVHALVQELAVYEKARDEMWLSVEDYRKYLKANLFECHLAINEGTVAGMILFYPTFSTWKGPMLHLEDFIVTDNMRRLGIGQMLMDHFLKIAKDRNVSLVKWEVLEWNTPAIKFYEKYQAIFEKDWWNVKMIF